MSNILYSSPTYKNPLVNIPPAQFTTQILFKVLRVQHEDIFQKQSAESQKVKKQTTTRRNAFWFSQLIGFQQVVFDCRLGCCLSRKGFVCVSVMCGTVYKKRLLCFYMFQVVIIYLLPPPDTYVIYYTISSNQFLLISDS